MDVKFGSGCIELASVQGSGRRGLGCLGTGNGTIVQSIFGDVGFIGRAQPN